MSANLSRHQYKRRYVIPRIQLSDERNSLNNERIYSIELNRHRAESILSFYDNDIDDENKPITSKWTIIRHRLPDILALSTTYKPTNMQTQLILLIGMMRRQAKELSKLNPIDHDHHLSCLPSNVIINIDGRRRIIYLKRIPPDQMIHVEVDQLSFSIPTRQFIVAISRGNVHQTAAKYCPPALSDLLINLSQTKVVDDSKQYKRALFKMRFGQMLFFIVRIFISGMMLVLIVSTGNTLFKFNSLNYSNTSLSITSLSSNIETEDNRKWR